MKSIEWPQRRSPRLKDYDYTCEGAYFVTICVQHRLCLFGDVIDGDLRPSDAGIMVAQWWEKLPDKYADVSLDAYVVMPNHFHGIVAMFRDESRPSLTRILQWHKTMTTNDYIRGVKQHRWTPFPGKLWQPSFYDHIIRHEESLDKTREYIANNPSQWHLDKNDPENPHWEKL